MHCLRRSALRVLTTSSQSLVSKSTSLPAAVPFRSIAQTPIVAPISRSFSIHAVKAYSQAEQGSPEESAPTSADSVDQSSISEAVSAATEATSTAPSPDSHEFSDEAKSPIKSEVELGREEVVATARAAAAAVDPETRPKRIPQNYPQNSPARPTNSIYVGNIYFGVGEQDLQELFSPYGNVVSARVVKDVRGLSKGFAYVEFENVDSATAAINAQDGEVYAGRRLVVNYVISESREKEKRTNNPPSKTVFIGNMPYEMTDADLNRLFREIRNVIDVRVAIDRRTGQPRGFAHADFVDVPSATEALKYLQQKTIYGRQLRCDYALFAARSRANPAVEGESGSSLPPSDV